MLLEQAASFACSHVFICCRERFVGGDQAEAGKGARSSKCKKVAKQQKRAMVNSCARCQNTNEEVGGLGGWWVVAGGDW